MKNQILDKLLGSGSIAGYDYVNVDEDGNVNQKSKFRNSEQIILYFNNGEKLILDTFCSGSEENTVFCISE